MPKVSDFGLCRDIRDLPHLTSLGLIHCTPEYSSPEQARGDKDIDIRADLYSLGVTLYEMLTGKLPFEALDAAMSTRHELNEATHTAMANCFTILEAAAPRRRRGAGVGIRCGCSPPCATTASRAGLPRRSGRLSRSR